MTRRVRRACGSKDESGQATVEFALLLPALLFVILAMLDVGKAINYWIDETHLANVAARWAVVNKSPVSGQSIETAVKNQADSTQLKNGVTISLCFPNSTSGTAHHDAAVDPVQAKATYTYNWLGFLTDVRLFPKFNSLGAIHITTKATMLLEQPFTGTSSDAYSVPSPNGVCPP